MLGFMKIFIKLFLISMLAITLGSPLTAFAESSHLDEAKKSSRASAALNFSIVVLPSLQLRISAPQSDPLTLEPFSGHQAAQNRVSIEANSGSVSFNSTVAGPNGTSSTATTLAADRKLVRANSHRVGSLRNLYIGQGRNGGVSYTVTQL